MAPPGRWGHILNPGDSVIIKLQCFWLFGFLSEVTKKSFLVPQTKLCRDVQAKIPLNSLDIIYLVHLKVLF